MELRQAGERVAQLSCREKERDPLRQQTARHEGQHPRGRTIEPLRVINDTQERLLFGGLGQQAKDGQSDQERIRRGVGGTDESERDAKRLVLGLR